MEKTWTRPQGGRYTAKEEQWISSSHVGTNSQQQTSKNSKQTTSLVDAETAALLQMDKFQTGG